MGKLYVIGVGSSDPELITIKAIKVLKKVNLVFVPSADGKNSLAYDIAKEYINCDVKFLNFEMNETNQNADINSKIITKELQDKDCGLLVLGDPTLYSTFFKISSELARLNIEFEIIPGVPSFCAAASKLKIPLAQGYESLKIVPYNSKKFQDSSFEDDNIVFLKTVRNVEQLESKIFDRYNFYFISKLGFEDECISFNKIPHECVNYFSMVIAKRR